MHPEQGDIRPTRVTVDRNAIATNCERIAALSGGDLFAVVKADAYGHGAVAVATHLEGVAAVHGFAVSLVEEGSELRDAGVAKPILVMGPALAGGLDEIAGRDMIAMVSELSDLEGLAAVGRRRGAPVSVHLKFDTGMGRLGLDPRRMPDIPDGAAVCGIATHLASADTDDPDDPDCQTHRQLAAFAAIDGASEITYRHAANSAGAIRFPGARLSAVRAGLAIYGNGVAPEAGLVQAMRMTSGVAQLRRVPKGAPVSYNALWTAERNSVIAVVPVGYADGLPRALTGRGEALVGGQRCPFVGAICMDIALVDVTDVPRVRVGDEVVLLGQQGACHITTAEFGARSDRIEYEVTCGVSKRVPRRYT